MLFLVVFSIFVCSKATIFECPFYFILSPSRAVISVENFMGGHICNGILVGDDVALTAAHCVNGVAELYVRANTRSLGFGGQLVPVIKTCPLGGYEFISRRNDIAILKLATKLAQALHAKLPGNVTSTSDVTVQGWGFNTQGVLQALPVIKVPETDCRAVFGNSLTGETECFRYCGAFISCLAEARGSPLMRDETVVGINAGLGSCDPFGSPAVFTKIPANIQSELGNCKASVVHSEIK